MDGKGGGEGRMGGLNEKRSMESRVDDEGRGGKGSDPLARPGGIDGRQDGQKGRGGPAGSAASVARRARARRRRGAT